MKNQLIKFVHRVDPNLKQNVKRYHPFPLLYVRQSSSNIAETIGNASYHPRIRFQQVHRTS